MHGACVHGAVILTRRLLLLMAVLAFATFSFTPEAPAAAFGCASLSRAFPVMVGIPVPAPYPNSLLGPCPGGQVFSSATLPCPMNNPGPVALAGEYCGQVPSVPQGATIVCTGHSTPGNEFEALVVGLDYPPYDGNILGSEPLTYEGIYLAGVHSASITNPGPSPARVIAYPVDVAGPGPILVFCVL